MGNDSGTQAIAPTAGRGYRAFVLGMLLLVYSFSGGKYSIGVHGKNLTDVRYKTSGYQYISSTLAGVPILTPAGGYTPTLGKEGIATAFYGNPRQVFGTFTAKF